MTISWATAAHAEAKGWRVEAPISWERLVEMLSTHDIRAAKDGMLWAPVSVASRGARVNGSVKAVHALVLDFDQGTPIELVRPRLDGLAWVGHSSHRHSPHKPKYRVVVQLSQPVDAAEWPEVWKVLHGRLGPESDIACKNANRIYYLPSCPEESCFDAWTERSDGAPIDVGPILEQIRAPKPVVAHVTTPRERPAGKGDYTTLDVVAWAGANGVKVVSEQGGEGKHFLDCPWKAEHTDGHQGARDTYLLPKPGEHPIFYCAHSHCKGRGFLALRQIWQNVDAYCGREFVGTYTHREPPPERRPMQDEDLPEPPPSPGVADATDQEITDAVDQATRPGIDWNPCTRDGDPKCGVSNAAIFLLHLFFGKTLRFNEFTRFLEVDGEPVREPMVAQILERIEQVSGQTKWSRSHIDMAVMLIAADVPRYHPVRSYLQSLPVWDMVERIPFVLDGCLQEAPKEIYRRYLECFFISAVARVMDPGCKADTALILQGAQGVRKSSFFRCLMPQESWFSDDMGSLETKDAQMAIGRSWIVEWAELESLRRSNVNSVKAFLSRQVDQFRPPYGREIIDVPRSAIIVGSTNEAQFLTDSTGSRRYMVIPVSQIDTDAVEAMRDQLWAEAYAKWLAKIPWYLTPEERIEQEAQNAEMTSDDPWLSAIAAWLPSGGIFSSSGFVVTMSKLLGSCLEIPKERQTRSAQMRVSSILAELGWVRKQRFHEDQKQWVYVAPEGWGK